MAVMLHESSLADAADRLWEELPGHRDVLLCTAPFDGKYPDPLRCQRGRAVPVPESVGVALELSVDTFLDGDD